MKRKRRASELTARVLACLSDEAKHAMDPKRMAIRSFELLHEQAADRSGQEKALIWGALAKEIHQLFHNWKAAGPYEISEGGVAYWGGIPRGYIVVFRADGEVFLGKRGGRPGRSWKPDYDSLERLAQYVDRHRFLSELR